MNINKAFLNFSQINSLKIHLQEISKYYNKELVIVDKKINMRQGINPK